MKTLNEAGVEALAAQYVLGVLQGPARKRFEREMMRHWRIRQEVWFWERQLQPLAERGPAITPPPQVWSQLTQRLWPSTARTAPPVWRHWLWQGWSLSATAATALLATVLWWQSTLSPTATIPQEQWLAIVQSPQAEPLWVVDADARATQVRLKSIAAPAVDAQKDFELWLLPRQGAPQSIGILPTGQVEVTLRLSTAQFAALLQNQSLAISIEPKGGSPTGLPTGPVVYQTKLLKI